MAEMAEQYDHLIKILILMDIGDDNTRILFAGKNKDFKTTSVSIDGVDFGIKNIVVAGKRCRLQIRDTAGRERFTTIHPANYFKGVMGVMIVYDITDMHSFHGIESWLRSLEVNAAEETQVILVGNKCHKEAQRQVESEVAEAFASSYGIKFIEVSSQENINIEKAFITLTKDILGVLKIQGAKKHLTEMKLQKDSHSGKDKGLFQRLIQPLFGGKTLSRTSVPDDFQQDPYALDLYKKALRDGTEKDRSIRVNIVGNFGQGKTSLMRRLLRKKVTDVSSTDGIDVSHYKCSRTADGKFSFAKTEEKDQSDIVERLVSVALTSNDKETLKTNVPSRPDIDIEVDVSDAELKTPKKSVIYERIEQNQDEETPVDQGQQTHKLSTPDIEASYLSDVDNNARSVTQSKQSMLSVNEKKSFTKILNKRKSHTSKGKTQTLFDIWDFGGQHVFYATHTLFHSRNAIYLLVFDLSLELKSVLVDKDFPEESDEKDMKYFLHFWMNSIHSFVGSDDGSKPKVILVGTHRDKLKGNAENKHQHCQRYFNEIRASLDGTNLLNHLHYEDFAVDNTIGKDEEVSTLRDTIVNLGNAQATTIEIPAKWIMLEKALSERKHEKIIPFDMVLAIDEQNEVPVGDPEEIKLFLRYHHGKGTYIYFDEEQLSEHVVLSPQFLIDAFKCIITAERFCTNDRKVRPLWKMLRTEGRLEKLLIEKQWGKVPDKRFLDHKDVLISFLTKHHIISEAFSFDDGTQETTQLGWFVVPSLLKARLRQTDVQPFLKGRKQTLVRYVMLFDSSTIVPTIYHRLMAALIGKWPIAQFCLIPLICKDKCIVRLSLDYAGIAELRNDTIELTVVSLCLSTSSQSQQADVFRRFTEAVISHEFSKLERKHENYTQPYSTRYRCNDESHDENGSLGVIEIGTNDEIKPIPCPDLVAHTIDIQKAAGEWFQDYLKITLDPDFELNDQTLSKISSCIGRNWQLLGLELGLTQVQIEQISEDHPHSTVMKIYYMLKTWCGQMEDLANMNVLVQAMQACPDVSVHWDGIRNIAENMM